MKQIPIIFPMSSLALSFYAFDNAYRIHSKHTHQQSSLMQINPYAGIKNLISTAVFSAYKIRLILSFGRQAVSSVRMYYFYGHVLVYTRSFS